MSAEQNNPLELWNRVCKTDPNHTKQADNGKYKFTCVDPQHQLHEATAMWGPYGGKWGLKELRYSHHEIDAKHTIVLNATFFCPQATFEVCADMPFRWNDDAYKKLLTAARSKSLSLLGFNADVFLGQYDDERYVQEMRNKYADQDELRVTMLNVIADCHSDAQLEKCRERVKNMYSNNTINKTLRDECLEAIDGWQPPQNGAPSKSEQEKIRQQELAEANQ